MYGLDTRERCAARRIAERQLFHTIYGESMTAKHGNYKRKNLRHLRRVQRGGGEFPTRQRLMQDVASGIHIRVFRHLALGAIVSLASPVVGRDHSAAGAPLRCELRINGHQLPTGPFCLVGKLLLDDSPSLFAYASVQSALSPHILTRLLNRAFSRSSHIAYLQIFDGDQAESSNNVRSDAMALVAVPDALSVLGVGQNRTPLLPATTSFPTTKHPLLRTLQFVIGLTPSTETLASRESYSVQNTHIQPNSIVVGLQRLVLNRVSEIHPETSAASRYRNRF